MVEHLETLLGAGLGDGVVERGGHVHHHPRCGEDCRADDLTGAGVVHGQHDQTGAARASEEHPQPMGDGAGDILPKDSVRIAQCVPS